MNAWTPPRLLGSLFVVTLRDERYTIDGCIATDTVAHVKGVAHVHLQQLPHRKFSPVTINSPNTAFDHAPLKENFHQGRSH